VACKGATLSVRLAEEPWTIGDRALLTHVYGGIGGRGGERAASGPIYFGHFAFGLAQVVADPLSGDARFEIAYHQVYTHNTDGLIAGRLHWSRYIADRQFGWLGLRPTCDVAYKLDAVGDAYTIGGRTIAPLDALALQLDAMTARYRIGDGTGGTYVGAANNCAQDSNRALFAALGELDAAADVAPEHAARYARLAALVADVRRELAPFGHPRRDWSDNVYNLGSTMQAEFWEQLRIGLGSWRVILPRLAADTLAGCLLRHGAHAWVLGTDQVHDRPELTPVVPLTL
jgi:predicted Abi (CAAX) family protease